MSDLDLQLGFADAMSKLPWSRAGYPLPTDAAAGAAASAEPQIDIIGARNQVVGVQIRLAADQDFVLTLDHLVVGCRVIKVINLIRC